MGTAEQLLRRRGYRVDVTKGCHPGGGKSLIIDYGPTRNWPTLVREEARAGGNFVCRCNFRCRNWLRKDKCAVADRQLPNHLPRKGCRLLPSAHTVVTSAARTAKNSVETARLSIRHERPMRAGTGFLEIHWEALASLDKRASCPWRLRNRPSSAIVHGFAEQEVTCAGGGEDLYPTLLGLIRLSRRDLRPRQQLRSARCGHNGAGRKRRV